MAHPISTRKLVRESLEEFENAVCALEGVLELVTPYTSEEGARATLRRESVSWALAPVTHALRAALDQAWESYTQGEAQ